MNHCMRCNVGITRENYVFSWTLMCKSCDDTYNKEQKKKIKKEKKQEKKNNKKITNG